MHMPLHGHAHSLPLQDEWLGKIHAALHARGITVLSIVADGGSQNQKSNRRMRWLANNTHTCTSRCAVRCGAVVASSGQQAHKHAAMAAACCTRPLHWA